jgi:6-phosphogluconolactonase (cycloisomerase 2 family)
MIFLGNLFGRIDLVAGVHSMRAITSGAARKLTDGLWAKGLGVSASFASPASAPAGLTFDGTNLISCDIGTDLIYIHDGITSTILSSFASPDITPTGLAFDGANLISCDYATDIIYIHDGVTSTILSSFAAPASAPRGLTFDGTNLISCDPSTDLIYIYG